MSKKYDKLWVFGDSFSTPNFCVKAKNSFWGLTATKLSVNKLFNYSWPRNSLDSIVHTLICEQRGDSWGDAYDWSNDFFLIGVPPLSRLTVVSKNNQIETLANEINIQQDWKDFNFDVTSHRGLINLSSYCDVNFAIHEDSSWTQTQAMRNIFLLNSWLDSKKANYLIVNLSVNFYDDNSSFGNFLLEQCLNHPRNVLFTNSYYNINLNINKPADFDQYGWLGHHGPAGNQRFFEKSILPALEKNNLI